MKKVCLCALSLIWCASVLGGIGGSYLTDDHLTTWQGTASEGFLNDPLNWSSGLPTNGCDGAYGVIDLTTLEQDSLTLKVPPEGFTSNAGYLFVDSLEPARTTTLTFDTRGSFWEVRNVKSANDWVVFSFNYNLPNVHMFNMEGAKSTENTLRLLRLENALFQFESASRRKTWTLQQGSLMWDCSLTLGGNASTYHPEFILMPGSSFTCSGNFLIRDASPRTDLTILGGTHTIRTLAPKDRNSFSTSPAYVTLTNDAVLTCTDLNVSGQHHVNGKALHTTATVQGAGTSSLTVTHEASFGYNGGAGTPSTNLFNRGYLNLSEQASMCAQGDFFLGKDGTCTGAVTLVDSAHLTAQKGVRVGAGTGKFHLQDDASLLTRALAGTAEHPLTVTADGGTVQAFASEDAFFESVDLELLERGLTLDTQHYSVGLSCFISGEGTLRKTGLGRLTLHTNISPATLDLQKGTLQFASNVTQLATHLICADNTTLQWDEAHTPVALASLTLENRLLFKLPSTFPLDTPTPLLTVAGGLPANLINQASTIYVEGYTHELSCSSDGTQVLVTQRMAPAAQTYTWQPTTGRADEASNWNPTGIPTPHDHVLVPHTASLDFNALSGLASLSVTASTPSDVTLTSTNPFTLHHGVDVCSASSLTINAPLEQNGTPFQKTGGGTLKLSGDNHQVTTPWHLLEGTTEFQTVASLGSETLVEDALSLSNNTIRYTGAEPATVARPLRLASELPAHFDIQQDLTFSPFSISYAQTDGGFVKTGTGTLTLHNTSSVPKLTVSSDRASVPHVNSMPSGTFAPTSEGTIANWNGLMQLSILEGTLCLQGAGRNQTDVTSLYHTLVGGGGLAARTPPRLLLKNTNARFGSAGYHLMIGWGCLDAGADPEFVLNDTTLSTDGIFLGTERTPGQTRAIRPVLALTNSTITLSCRLDVPKGNGFAPIVRVGQGALIQRKGLNTMVGGVVFNSLVDARFEDGGMLEIFTPQSLWMGDATTGGTLAFTRGGALKTTQVIFESPQADPARHPEILFDGGFLTFNETNLVTMARRPDLDGLTSGTNGLTISVGQEHTLGVPIKGCGALTKTGTGTLVVTNALKYTNTQDSAHDTTRLTFDLFETAVPMLQHEGPTTVREGTLALAPGVPLSCNPLFTVEKDALFDLGGNSYNTLSVAGAGTVENGSFGGALRINMDEPQAPTLKNLTQRNFLVDFERDDTFPRYKGAPIAVAHLGEGMAPFATQHWKGVHVGNRQRAQFSCNEQTVYATICDTGMILIFR